MSRVIIAATFVLALAGTGLLWAASGQAGRDPKIGTRVTITGCLHQGTERGSFVLLGVTERPADTPAAAIRPVPYAIYWLDSNDGLKPLVGEMVDVTGKVTERREKRGTITVSLDPTETKSKDVQVVSGNKDLDVTTKKFDDRPRPVGTSGSPSEVEVTRPVYKLDVENVRAVNIPTAGPACR
ncbi:MAG: hypothetical protein A3H96_18840 [Acidobacteria bacterium RIFCSPLOWO2_02_FULL_67_36]|nr:MAG: hypothetical protein A3H96_18840 [Acidobacteria bacterium RIFCSPLOWO2_02_FULL_67_36]OFW18914.1 MAG: hypothetical protein A3G21_04170 [Acidobacteria bacterium RIFCSPLOWO2_12_FULL_66_21]